MSLVCMLNVTLLSQCVAAVLIFKRQLCWSMKETWWHILELFEPIKVMYVLAVCNGVLCDTLGWSCILSFFRVIIKTSHAMAGRGGGVSELSHSHTVMPPQKWIHAPTLRQRQRTLFNVDLWYKFYTSGLRNLSSSKKDRCLIYKRNYRLFTWKYLVIITPPLPR